MIEIACSDIDFYERKIIRLENDISNMHDELTTARMRLRTAEDYQIKYELLLRHSQSEAIRFKDAEKVEDYRRQELTAMQLKDNEDKWQARLLSLEKEHAEKVQTLTQTKNKEEQTRVKLEELQAKFNELQGQREEAEMFGFKIKKFEKENETLHEQIEEMKAHYELKKEEELEKVKSILMAAHRDKIRTDREIHDYRLAEAAKRADSLQFQLDQLQLQPKTTSNDQLARIQQLLAEKNEFRAKELEELSKTLTAKDQQIAKVRQDSKNFQSEHKKQLAELRRYIKELEDKLFSKEKQHEIEIFHLIERLNRAKTEETAELRAQIELINSAIARERDHITQQALNIEEEKRHLKKDMEDERNRLNEEKRLLKEKLAAVHERLNEFQQNREVGETEQMIESLKEIDAKAENFGNYENGVTFLERLVKKAGLKLEQKNREVNKLITDMNALRRDMEEELAELKGKFKKEKKDFIERVSQLEAEVRDLNNLLRTRDRELRKKEKDISNERVELEVQNKSLKDLCEELQRDYNRIVESKKIIQNSYREERQKGLCGKTDVSEIKRQKFLEIEKIKANLEVVFREKEGQLRMEKDIQIDSLRSDNIKLKQTNELVAHQNAILKKELQDARGEKREESQAARLSDYNKKMATLNLEIALTQNIYESLIEAKSRVNSGVDIPLSRSFGTIDPPRKDSSPFRQFEFSPKVDNPQVQNSEQELLMSFHPNRK